MDEMINMVLGMVPFEIWTAAIAVMVVALLVAVKAGRAPKAEVSRKKQAVSIETELSRDVQRRWRQSRTPNGIYKK